MRRWLGHVLISLALLGAGPSIAQEPLARGESPILTLDQDRLYTESLFGRRSLALIEDASRTLVAENREIEARLIAEERSLTDLRPTLPIAEFRVLADEFDKRVEGIRRTQDAKARTVNRQQDEEKQRFFQAAVPILGAITSELGALAILDKGAIVLAFDRIDITDQAIARVDAVLGDGVDVPADPATAPAPAPANGAQDGAPANGN